MICTCVQPPSSLSLASCAFRAALGCFLAIGEAGLVAVPGAGSLPPLVPFCCLLLGVCALLVPSTSAYQPGATQEEVSQFEGSRRA